VVENEGTEIQPVAGNGVARSSSEGLKSDMARPHPTTSSLDDACQRRGDIMTKREVAAVLLGLPLAGGLHSVPARSQTVQQTIIAKEKAAMERWRHGDPMGWAETSADEVTYFDPDLGAPIRGMDAYRPFLESWIGKVHYDGSNFIDPRVAVYGSVAVLTYNYASTVLGEDGKVVRRTPWNTTEVYALQGSDWRIVHTHWSYLHEKLPEQVDVPIPVKPRVEARTGLLATLVELESASMNRWRQGDPATFLDLAGEEITYFDPTTDRRVDGVQALRRELAGRPSLPRFDVMEFIDPYVQMHGDAAILTFRFFSTVLASDGSVASRTPWNCTEVFVKRDGRWRIVHTHWSYIGGALS
jgi:ketosteroid isomerase-like protein